MDRRAFLKRSAARALGLAALGLPGCGGRTGGSELLRDLPEVSADWPAEGYRSLDLPAVEELIAEDLLTVAPDRAAVAWVTDSALPSVLTLEREGEPERQIVGDGPPKRFHLVEVEGLDPGTPYRYRTTRGDPSWADPFGLSPREFVTPEPPPGERLFRFATVNDIHIGVKEVGLISGLGEPFTWPDPANPHWRFPIVTAVEEINRRGVDFVIVKGDITSGFTKGEFETARQILDGLDPPCYPMRGNHDRVGGNPDDYYLSVFGDLLPGSQSHFSFSHKGFRFLCLDSSNLEDGHPLVSEEQLGWLGEQLKTPDPTFVCLHHAVTKEASILFSLLDQNREDFIATVSPHDHVVGILSGHSHRDRVTHEDALGPVPCVETAATLHFPLGYTVYDVYPTGWVQTCFRMNCPPCLEWAEMTKGLYFGSGVELLFLPAEQRCFTHLFQNG